jgi:MFS family permease
MSGARGGGYAVYILLLMLVVLSLSYADRYLFSILIPAIKAEFGTSDTVLGLIAGPGFIVSYIIFTMPFARLADLWSRRKVLALSAMIWSAATAACGLAGGVFQLAAARFIVGVGEAGAMPPAQSIVAGLFSERRRGSALGVLTAAPYLGTVAGLAGGGALAAAVGWRDAFLWLALPGLPLALLIWATGPRRASAPLVASAPRTSALAALRNCWSIPSLRLLAVGAGTYNIFGYAGATWLPSYFMRSHGMSLVEAGAWLGIGAAAGGVIGTVASGILIDRLRLRDARWQLWLPAIAFLLSFPMTIAMLAIPGGASLAGMPLVAILSVVTGLLAATWFGPSLAAVASLVSVHERSQASAILVVTISVVGSLLGPVVAGAASQMLTPIFGGEALRYGLLAVSPIILLASLFFWRASQHYRADLAR